MAFSTPATASSPAGVCPITPGGLTSNNYALTFVDGSLTVSYGIRVLHDQRKPVKSGSTIPVKLQIVDAAGTNLSASSIPVTAASVVLVGGIAATAPEDSGNANPDLNFRYDGSLGVTSSTSAQRDCRLALTSCGW